MKRLKGEPRRKTIEGRKLRQMAAQLGDKAAFEAFVATAPERHRAQVRQMLIPLLHFDLKPDGESSPETLDR